MACLDLLAISPQMSSALNARILNYKVVEDGKYAVYTVQICVDVVTWTVERRYSEFDNFDQKRFPDRKKSFLPPKKIVGNLDPDFLEERSRELEKYIRALLELEIWGQKQKRINSLPMITAKFFDFHQYEVHSIVNDLSIRLGTVGDEWLTASETSPKYFEFTPIEMFSITERLKLPEPTAPDPNMVADVGNTIEFLHRVKALKIRGSKGYVGTSNLVWAALGFNLSFCKSLMALWLVETDVARIRGFYSLKDSLRRVVVHYSMTRLQDLILDEDVPVPIEDVEPWMCLEDADFSFNEIVEIDESVRLLGPVTKINFSNNNIKDVGYNIQHLTNLVELDLSANEIFSVERWNEKLGNLKKLTLAGNRINNLTGLSKIYSLEYLDMRENDVASPEAVRPLGKLPCLEVLILRGNPIRKTVDYRTRVLESFGERCKEMKLDSRRPDDREMDTIRVRLALRKAKEEKAEQERKRQERIQERLRYISGEVNSPSGSL